MFKVGDRVRMLIGSCSCGVIVRPSTQWTNNLIRLDNGTLAGCRDEYLTRDWQRL